MLTKDLLKFRISQGRVKPTFVAPKDKTALAVADELIALFHDSQGQTFGELEEAYNELGLSAAYASGFKKILDQLCDEEVDESVEARRWTMLEKAETLRSEMSFTSILAFETRLSETTGLDVDKAREQLYADLPLCRKIKNFKELSSEALIHRYNLALVQGLLLRAREVTISLNGAKLAEKRMLFRALKFHRLMSEVDAKPNEDHLSVTLSGPLTLFDKAQTYGMRLANFFPHLVTIAGWQMEALVQVKNRDLGLKLDDKSELVSHYRMRGSYIPPELMAFLDQFNERAKLWRASPSEEFVDIGRQSYCFPDITINGHDGRVFHVELFHRWHAGQLHNRLKTLEKNPVPHLLIGISKTLQKNENIRKQLAESDWFATQGFLFGDFPTPRALLTLLAPT